MWNSIRFIQLLIYFHTIWCVCFGESSEQNELRIGLTVSARWRTVEISWFNAKPMDGDVIIVTDTEVTDNVRMIRHSAIESVTHRSSLTTVKDLIEGSGNSEEIDEAALISAEKLDSTIDNDIQWIFGDENRTALFYVEPNSESRWITTNIPFNYTKFEELSIDTKCYGFWVTYVKYNGDILKKNCFKLNPTWMNDMKADIEHYRFRDLFIPGTHDSTSYKVGFNPFRNETLVTKYSITQDETIYSQLLHGIRYIDLRVGYYRASKPAFWANHGVARMHPLNNILHQIRDFVRETNEIVVVDVQEFPVGFGQKPDIHHLLVKYIQDEIGDEMADGLLSWHCHLKDIWAKGRRIIVAYDRQNIVQEHSILWTAVQQRWANAQSLTDLKRYLSYARSNYNGNYMSRPIADMAELTPDTWGVVTDRYGGLRRMADIVNRHASKWYLMEWGLTTNVVAVDFYKGTNIVETALMWNRFKVKNT